MSVDNYFIHGKDKITEDNWKTMKIMSLVYLVSIVCYYLGVCLCLGFGEQKIPLLIAVAAQAVFSAVVFSIRRTPSFAAVNCALILFALMIIALAIYLDIFTAMEGTIIFPLVLLMLTQFYSLPPKIITPLLLGSGLLFIVLSYMYTPGDYFVFAAVSTVIALAIAFVAHYTIMKYRTIAYDREEELKFISSMDQLTHALNKMSFSQKFNEMNMRRNQRFAIAMADIDDFKAINDVYGHLAGDAVLQQFVDAMRECFSASTCESEVGRFGGDEFLIYVTGFEKDEELDAMISCFQKKVSSIDADLHMHPSCSIGVVISESTRNSINSLINIADNALYEIKRSGGNSYKIIRI
jgi:diguanylate cyclase (GGDEF)-like protein